MVESLSLQQKCQVFLDNSLIWKSHSSTKTDHFSEQEGPGSCRKAAGSSQLMAMMLQV